MDRGAAFLVTHILALAVIGSVMAAELAQTVLVELCTVRHHGRLFRNVGVYVGDDFGRRAARYMVAAHVAAALNQRKDDVLVGAVRDADALFAFDGAMAALGMG